MYEGQHQEREARERKRPEAHVCVLEQLLVACSGNMAAANMRCDDVKAQAIIQTAPRHHTSSVAKCQGNCPA